MPEALADLEQQRTAILRQISELATFRPGSITGTGGRCGNPGCHCHRPKDPGHRPHPRLTYKINGKSITESFATPAARRKAEREIKAFRRYQQLERSFVEVNEKICRAPHGGDAKPAGKKTAEAVQREVIREVDQLLNVVLAALHKTGRLDLEAIETATRAAMHRAGACALSQLLQFAAPPPDQRQLPCPCGHQAQYQELRSRPVSHRRRSCAPHSPLLSVFALPSGPVPG